MPSLVLGSARAQFTITLSVAASEPVSVEWFTKDGTALAGRDYEANSGTVVFAPGEVTKTVEVFVHGRTVETEDRVFYVRMLPPVNAILADEVGACVIQVDTTGSQPVMTVVIPKGEKGERGYSAYEIALQNGFVGTEAEWLESLKPDPAEVAEEVAPLLVADNMPVTAKGTETLTPKDTDTLAGVAGRIPFMPLGKKAVAPPLSAGTNIVPLSAFIGEPIDAMDFTGFSLILRRGSTLLGAEWEYLPDSEELRITGAQAGDIPIAVNVSVGGGDASEAVVNSGGIRKKLKAWFTDLYASLAGGLGAAMIGYIAVFAGAVLRTLLDKVREPLPTLEDFGGKGDYVTLNDNALAALVASGAKGMNLNRGIYRLSDGTTFPAGFIIRGVGAPTLGFGTLDDKQWLRDGYKHLMPGSSLIFSGGGTLVATAPQRVDEFATMRPCVRLKNLGAGSVGTKWSGFAIIQDMVCRTADGANFTKPAEDNRSDYEVGLLIDDAARSELTDVVVFGYFPKAGTVISSVSGNDDPDYNTFRGGSTMGKHGLAILGSNNGPAEHGLSGTRAFGMGIYNLDHHSRANMDVAELTAYYAPAHNWSCIYIDGDVNAASAEINGHEFHACEIRSRSNHGLRIDHASNVKFFGGVYEFTPYGITNSNTPTFIGSANVKRGIIFDGLRNNYLTTIFNDNFVGLIPLPVVVIGDPLNGRLGVFHKDPAGGYSGVILGSDGNIGDAAVQLTKDANNGNSGWRDTIDVSAGNPNQKKYDGAVRWAISTMGAMSVSAPAANDASILISSDNGANLWAIRPQVSSTGQLQFRPGGTSGSPVFQIRTSGTLVSATTGTADVGEPAVRYNNGYWVNSPNVSSDQALKTLIEEIPLNWIVAAKNVRRLRYKMKAAVAEKGDSARWHVGVIAQEVLQAFADQGVDAFEIGIVGRDSWEDHYDDVLEPVLDEDGTPTGEYRPTGQQVLTRAAGQELSVRYEELLVLFSAADQHDIAELRARIA